MEPFMLYVIIGSVLMAAFTVGGVMFQWWRGQQAQETPIETLPVPQYNEPQFIQTQQQGPQQQPGQYPSHQANGLRFGSASPNLSPPLYATTTAAATPTHQPQLY